MLANRTSRYRGEFTGDDTGTPTSNEHEKADTARSAGVHTGIAANGRETPEVMVHPSLQWIP